MSCLARQYGDLMVCHYCEKRWDTNDPCPPPCGPVSRGYAHVQRFVCWLLIVILLASLVGYIFLSSALADEYTYDCWCLEEQVDDYGHMERQDAREERIREYERLQLDSYREAYRENPRLWDYSYGRSRRYERIHY